MSFLAGRLAATEGAFFLQESKSAAGRLAQRISPAAPGPAAAAAGEVSGEAAADVLPEILRHGVRIKVPSPQSDASLASGNRWVVPVEHADGVPAEVRNPISALVSLPQATFGPKRWQLAAGTPYYSPSTANDMRRDRYPPAPDPEKLKAMVAGYAQIGKAFLAATVVVFGGATAACLYAADKLQLRTADDIRNKGRDAIQPRIDSIKEQMAPLRNWADNMANKWHFEADKEAGANSIIKELSKTLGASDRSKPLA